MKRLILLLLAFVMAAVGGCCSAALIDKSRNEEAVVQTMDAAPSFLEETLLIPSTASEIRKPVTLSADSIPEVKTNAENLESAQFSCNDDIPLTGEEQEWLWSACEEFEVPYALALGLIEKESNFKNISGDGGASAGYMQIQLKWHGDRMKRLGVTDLLDPRGNFRVGLDFLSELHGKYEDWAMALTVYNMGHDPGHVTNYANAVMDNYVHWRELIETSD